MSIDFNICAHTFRTCPDGGADFANLVNMNNTCLHLSNAVLADTGVELISSSEPDLGLILTYKGASMCNATAPYSFQV
jgi:hypothetical protein